MLPIDPLGIDLVKKFEGLKKEAYRCPAGVWTIGYGHTDGVYKGQTITEPQAESLLAQDLEKAASSVKKLVKVPINVYQLAALSSFVFNVGAGNLAASTLLKRLNNNKYDCIPSELAKWVKATDPKTGEKVTLTGLVKRRAAEAELWLHTTTPDPFIHSTDMPQRVLTDENRTFYKINARGGLRLREGAGKEFEVIKTLAEDIKLFVIREKNGWGAVDIEGDGKLDGWVSMDFLTVCQE